MDEEERLAVPRRPGVRARPEVSRDRKIDRDETLIRTSLARAIRARDVGSARQILRDMARDRSGIVDDPLERRLKESLAACTALIPSVKDRAALRRMIRESLVNSGAAGAIIALQAWAKPRQVTQSLISIGLSDMTCEFVMLEFVDQFSAEAVGRARRLLAEHEVVPPARK